MKKINQYLVEPFQNFVRIIRNPELRQLMFKKMYADVCSSIQQTNWRHIFALIVGVLVAVVFPTIADILCWVSIILMMSIFFWIELIESWPETAKGLLLIYNRPTAFPRLFRRWRKKLVSDVRRLMRMPC